jgi:hypothetical protein
MSAVAGPAGSRPDRDDFLLPIVLFHKSARDARGAPADAFFFAVVGAVLIGGALRRGVPWRELLTPRPALRACFLLVLYVFLNATWAADRGAAFGMAALLAGRVW